jgi:hypothetical protein
MSSEPGPPIAPDLIAAYRAADYHVHARPEFVIRVDAASAPLEALYRQRGVGCSSYLTAWNPHSRQLTTTENAQAQAALMDRLQTAGFVWLEGCARDPTGRWPDEPSVLVPGLEREPASKIAAGFGQNAIIWAGADAVPRLVLLR